MVNHSHGNVSTAMEQWLVLCWMSGCVIRRCMLLFPYWWRTNKIGITLIKRNPVSQTYLERCQNRFWGKCSFCVNHFHRQYYFSCPKNIFFFYNTKRAEGWSRWLGKYKKFRILTLEDKVSIMHTKSLQLCSGNSHVFGNYHHHFEKFWITEKTELYIQWQCLFFFQLPMSMFTSVCDIWKRLCDK